MSKKVGVLTAGGDCPGLNAAIRGLGKASFGTFNIHIIGFQDGFNGLVNDKTVNLEGSALSGILTTGGTILGTSRDSPQKMHIDDREVDMTDQAIAVYKKHKLDALVCMGGYDMQESALHLMQKGLKIITLPKTIDNDLLMTDKTVGFDTALGIATDAIDKLHSTAYSHHRIILVEIMGRNAGWLALGAGIAGGADVILIPEIPYDPNKIAEAILQRNKKGKRFSMIAVTEGAVSQEDVNFYQNAIQRCQDIEQPEEKHVVTERLKELKRKSAGKSLHLAKQLEDFTGLETRVTILGHLQRGGTPSAADRLLATQLGTACARQIQEGACGVMITIYNGKIMAVPLEDIVRKHKNVPLDHPWIESARLVGTCMGD